MSSGHGGDKGKVLEIHTSDLKDAAPVFHEQSKKLSKALTTLITKLDGLGKPWGNDDAGQKFEPKYTANQHAIERATGVLVLGLVSIHEAMQDMADGHVDNEELIRGMFTKPEGKGDK